MSEITKNLMVYHSNNLDYLSQLLAHIMKVNPLEDIFATEQVIVQSNGMKDWINSSLARHLGISMQISYSFPWAFVWQLLNKLGYHEESNPQQRFKMDNMVWTIYSILPNLILNDDGKINKCFESIYNYVIEPECRAENYKGECIIDHVKLFQLSQSIAKVFDGYMLYRTKWLQSHKSDQKNFYYDLYSKNFSLYKNSAVAADQNISESQVLDLLWQGISPDVWKKLPEKLRFLATNNMWQVVLWERVLEVNKSDHHIANMIDNLILDIDKDKHMQSLLPKRIFVFGISSLPPKFLELLKKLSSFIDVYYMLLNPCQEYWGDFNISGKDLANSRLGSFSEKLIRKVKTFPNFDDVKSERNIYNDDLSFQCYDDEGELKAGNSLLVSWGKQGRENLCQLLDAETSDIEIFEDPWNDKDPSTHTVLNAIKSDIFNMAEIDPYEQLFSPIKISRRKFIYDEKDKNGKYVMKHNLEIHSSYTRLREVECAYDAIIDRMAKDPTLKPNDFIVMVPNINDYVPFIRTVFEPLLSESTSEERAKRALPYLISDQTYESESPILKSVVDLLNIYKFHIDQNIVLEFLNVPQIQNKYELSNTDWEHIRNWIEKVHIRAEYDENELMEPGQTETLPVYNTWFRSFRRMIIGSMMISDQIFDENIQPYTFIEGRNDIEVLGKLKSFVDDLEELRNLLEKIEYSSESGISATEWKNFVIENVIEKFYLLDSTMDKDRATLERFLEELIVKFDNINPEYRIRVSVFQNYLQTEISGSRKFKSFMSGKVNFCTFLPMRSIPFRHIFLLGMNDGDFPKIDQELGFDLMMNGFQRRGDRSEREDGRYMFLETLISATDSLYISYIGKSIQDKSVRNPSCILSELENYLAKTFVTSKTHKEITSILEEIKSLSKADQDKKSDLLQQLFQCYKNNKFELMNLIVIEDPISSRDLANFEKRCAIKGKRGSHDFYVQSYQDEWYPLIKPDSQTLKFDSENKELAILDERQGRDNLSEDSDVPNLTITINQLVSFLNDPTEELYSRRFNVKNEWTSDPSPSYEPFTINNREENFAQANRYREFFNIVHSSFTYDELSEIFNNFKEESFNDRIEMILKKMIDSNKNFSEWVNRYEKSIFHSGSVPVGELGRSSASKITKEFAKYLDDVYFTYNYTNESELIDLTFDFNSKELPAPYCDRYPNGYKVRLTGIISNILLNRESGEKLYFQSNHTKNSEKFFNSVYVELLCLFQSEINNSSTGYKRLNHMIFDYNDDQKKKNEPVQYHFDEEFIEGFDRLLAGIICMYLSGMQHYMPTVIFDKDELETNNNFTIYNRLVEQIKSAKAQNSDNHSLFHELFYTQNGVCSSYLSDKEEELNISSIQHKYDWHFVNFIYRGCDLVNWILDKDPDFRTFEDLKKFVEAYIDSDDHSNDHLYNNRSRSRFSQKTMPALDNVEFAKFLLEFFEDYSQDEHAENLSSREYTDLNAFDLEQLYGYVFNCKLFPSLLLEEIKQSNKKKGDE